MLRSDFKDFKKQTAELSNKETSDPTPVVDDSLLKSLKIDQAYFQGVFNDLCKKWYNATSIPDCEGKRFVLRTLFKDLENPLKISIIADNLDLFKKHYQENSNTTLFDLCCICGSEKIINDFF